MKLLENEWLFISVRKCATNTLYDALPGKRTDRLFHTVPGMSRKAPIHWTVVRNPYDRAVSIWASTKTSDRYGVITRCNNDTSFENFIDSCLLKPMRKEKFLFKNQSDWLKDSIVDKIAKFENLNEDVNSITGLNLNLPRLNVSKRDDYMQYMTPAIIEKLNIWSGEDFQNYNYNKL